MKVYTTENTEIKANNSLNENESIMDFMQDKSVKENKEIEELINPLYVNFKKELVNWHTYICNTVKSINYVEIAIYETIFVVELFLKVIIIKIARIDKYSQNININSNFRSQDQFKFSALKHCVYSMAEMLLKSNMLSPIETIKINNIIKKLKKVFNYIDNKIQVDEYANIKYNYTTNDKIIISDNLYIKEIKEILGGILNDIQL